MNEGTTTLALQQLLNDLHAGNNNAKNDLIQLAYQRLIIVARKLLGSFTPVRAEEETTGVLHDAYLRLQTSLGDVKPTSVRQFMGLAALEIRRVLFDRIRKIKGRGKNARPDKISMNAPGADGFDIHDRDVDESKRLMALDFLNAIEQLPEDEREVVELLFFHGYTQPEAAEILGVHEDTVKRRWSRARIKLAEKLAAFA